MFIKKIVSGILIFLILFSPLMSRISYAEENTVDQTNATPAPTPDETQNQQVESTPTPTPDETISESPTPTPTIEISPESTPTPTPDETVINVATESGTIDSQATSGDNTIQSASGSADIQTGDADAHSDSQNNLNNNTITPTPDQSLTISNTASQSSVLNALGDSGTNIITDATNANINTGDAIASANQLNIINTNLLDSQLQLYLQQIFNGTTTDINLNDIWEAFIQDSANWTYDSSNENVINTANDATINVSATSVATSGDNTINNAQNGNITTGNAYAAANIINVANMNLFHSHLFFAIINIFDNYQGNIIVPNRDRFNEEYGSIFSSLQNQITNIATVQNNVNAQAISGENTENGGQNQLMQTGDSVAAATNNNYLNMNLSNIDWYSLFLNNFGIWDGGIYGYDSPSSISQSPNGLTFFDGSFGSGTDVDNNGNLTNTANVITNANAQATSGQNTINAMNSQMMTGRSVALANVLNFINGNIAGSNIFMPMINIFGSWKGNLIFAYPDLSIQMSSDKQNVNDGDTVNYTISYQNTGYDEARNAAIQIQIPGQEQITSSSIPMSSSASNTATFVLNTVGAGKSGSFSFQTIIKNNGSVQSKLPKDANFIAQIVNTILPEVHAADSGTPLVTTAAIASTDSEVDSQNNATSSTIYLMSNTNTTSSSDVNADVVPQLEVDSSTNVGSYIYSGDTITFFINVNNNNTAVSHATKLYQYLYDPSGNLLTSHEWDLGDLNQNTQKKITFKLQSPTQLDEGTYTSIFVADGLSTSGLVGTSNESSTQFVVQNHFSSLILGSVSAHEPEVKANSGRVLAAESRNSSAMHTSSYWLLYTIIALLSVCWMLERLRRKQLENELLLLQDEDLMPADVSKKVKKDWRKTLITLFLLASLSLLFMRNYAHYVAAQGMPLPPAATAPSKPVMPTAPNAPTAPAAPTLPFSIECTSTPTPTSVVPTSTPMPTATPEVTSTPGPTATPGPTETPTPGPSGGSGGGGGGNGGGNSSESGIALASQPSVLGAEDNYNPSIEGITNSYGEVLGAETEMPQTGVDADSVTADKLPSGNIMKSNSALMISKLGLNKPIYESQQLGSQLLVGDKEVLETHIGGHTILYGHDTDETFGRLNQLSVGDAIIRIENGKSMAYNVISIQQVSNQDTQAMQGPDDVLTLITCDIFDESFRTVINAQLVTQ